MNWRKLLKYSACRKLLIPCVVGGGAFLSFLCAAYYPALMPFTVGLGSLGLLFLAFTSFLELFLFFVASSMAAICTMPHNPLAVIYYGGYVILPMLALSIYKKYPPKEIPGMDNKNMPSIFHILIALLSMVTFFSSIMAPSLNVGPFYQQFSPGILSLISGAFFCIALICLASKVKYPITIPTIYKAKTFDYWWIVLCQLGALLFQGEDQLMSINMLLAAFLPFMADGLLNIAKQIPKKSIWLTTFIGFMSVLSAIPIICVVLYALLQPWIQRKDCHGKC